MRCCESCTRSCWQNTVDFCCTRQARFGTAGLSCSPAFPERGKTTIARLAPPDATLLTDEISYVRPLGKGYSAFGTPFTGELAKLGENVSAPVRALYLLAKGHENRIEAMAPAEAARSLLGNILFFAQDEELVQAIFRSTFDFVSRVAVSKLTFVPDARVWELIG